MLPKSVLLPKPRFKTIEEAQQWAEDLCNFFERFYANLYSEFNENTKVAVRGKDSRLMHGFFGSKDDVG